MHMLAFFGGFLLDLLFGDPYWLPHVVRLLGLLIAKTEHWLYREQNERDYQTELRKGQLLVLVVLSMTALLSGGLLVLSYKIAPACGFIVEMLLTYQVLAAKCLRVESMRVYACLCRKDLAAARTAVSMIVGRDTDVLDDVGVTKAAIETVAENTSDGVIAPMLYTALGGPVLGLLYKAVNTMDSMVGYKNERYQYFGKAAARLDDVVNWIPARFSAYLMILTAYMSGDAYCGAQAFAVWKRDRYKHASPNSAQTEAACAGALGIQLAGDASYFGKTVKKPYIGDARRPVEIEDIRRANHLMYGAAWICEILCLLVMLSVVWLGKE